MTPRDLNVGAVNQTANEMSKTVKHKSRLPDGRINPLWRRDYLRRHPEQNKTADQQREWRKNNPDKYRANAKRANQKYQQKRHEQGLALPVNSGLCRCVRCGATVRKKDVLEKGIKRLVGARGIRIVCGDCLNSESNE